MYRVPLAGFIAILIAITSPAPVQAQFVCGDVNADGLIHMGDLISLVNYIIDADSTLARPDLADINSFPGIDASDAVYMTAFLVLGGPLPCDGGPAGDDMVPGGEVTLDFVAGQSGPAVVAAGYPLTFNIRVTNNSDRYIVGMANGFNLYSPDGANIGDIELPDDSVRWEDLVFGSLWTYDPIAGEPFGNMALAWPTWTGLDPDSTTDTLGFPPSATGILYHVKVEPFGDEDIGKTICFDSAFYGNAGRWMWAVDGDNTLLPSWDGPHCFTIEEATYIPGDIDVDGQIAISDLVMLVDYMFLSGPVPPIMEACDVNGDCIQPDISDLIYMVDYMFDDGDLPLFSCTRPSNQ